MDVNGDDTDRAAIEKEIEEAFASLQQLRDMFDGREMPLSVAKMERAIRLQLEAAQTMLDC
jgi:hypothetical protein